nr:hypothetical protein [Tanacetum cinerariifolium]
DENSFAYDSTPNFVDDSPNVFNPPPQPPTDSYEFCGNDAHYSHDFPPQVPDHTEETSSGSTTTHADNSLPKYDSFIFEIEPDQVELTSVVMEDNFGEPRVHVPNVLPTHPTLMLNSDFIHSDNSLPESEIFCFHIEEKNSGSTTIHADISLLDSPNFEDSCLWFCPSITRALNPQLHFGNPIS